MYAKQVINERIGDKIRARRKFLKMTQKDLAHFLGVSFQQVQKYENGSSCVNMNTFLKICKSLHVTPEYFLESFVLKEDVIEQVDKDAEVELISLFRSVKSDKIKQKILNLIKVLAAESEK